MDEQEQLDRFAGQLYQGILAPEALRDVIDSLSAWLTEPPAIHDFDMGMPIVGADGCLADNDDPDRAAYLDAPLRIAPPVRRRRRCPECPIQQDINPNWQRVIDLLLHCRALRELADHAVDSAHTSHVAAIVLSPRGRVLDCDQRGESLLQIGDVLRLADGQLRWGEAAMQARFAAALGETAATGRTTNVLLQSPKQPQRRFSLTLKRMQRRPSLEGGGDSAADVLCLVAPLDQRRVATARQLMDLFSLSAAEARLARALANGDSVEEYARDHDLRLPTVRSQLRAVFEKTGTQRQATLVRLIAGIPVVRDSA
jgi:DNA-binding CsgD family transcriptional regulator